MAEEGTNSKLVYGIGGLIILVILTLIIVSTILSAGLFERNTGTVLNENEDVYLNSSRSGGYEVALNGSTTYGYTLLSIVNSTSSTSVVLANATLDSTTGLLTNATALTWHNVTINYTYVAKSDSELTPEDLAGNFTTGLDNISEKIPIILLIAAVVLLFGVLILLIARSKQIGIGGGGSL